MHAALRCDERQLFATKDETLTGSPETTLLEKDEAVGKVAAHNKQHDIPDLNDAEDQAASVAASVASKGRKAFYMYVDVLSICFS